MATLNDKLLGFIRTGLQATATAMAAPLGFRLFLDAGERESVRLNEYETRSAAELNSQVFGTLYLDPSNRAPIKGLTVLTIRATLEVLCELRRVPTDPSGEFPELERLRSVLDTFAASNNGQTFAEELDGKTFNITPNFSPAVVGDVMEVVSNFGEVLPLFLSVTFTAVEGGVSSNDVTIYIDGYPVYYESAVLTRSKMVDQYTYHERAPLNANTVQHGFGVDFIAPLLTGALGDALMREILGGSFNEAHAVSIERETIERETGERKKVINTYLCIFGNSSANLQPGKNVGATVSLVEGNMDLFSFYPTIWYVVNRPTDADVGFRPSFPENTTPSESNRVLVVTEQMDGTVEKTIKTDSQMPGNSQTARWVILRNGF